MNFAIGRWAHRVLGGAAALLAAGALMLPGVSQAGEVRFSGEGHAYTPVWSLDGNWIAFEVNRYAGDVELFVSQVNGTIADDALQIRLPGGSNPFGGGQVVVNPTWHPQGIMVFEGSNQSGKFRLYYASPGGAAAAEMLDKTKAPGDLTFPAVSPDGDWLAFVSDATGDGDIYTWNRNTDKMNQVTATVGSEMFPLFWKDGTKLLFTRKKNDQEAVYLIDLGTGAETTIAAEQGDQTRPNFTPDGRIVYFTNERATELWDLAVVDMDGSNKKILAQQVRLPLRARPSVTQDGQWVAYGSDDPTKDRSMYLVKVDGSTTVELTTEFVACGEPALTVQNGRTLLAYTALPNTDSDWRFLYVLDVTDKLQ